MILFGGYQIGRKRMNKQEFINRLRAALNGRVAPNLVIENVNYYEDYINTEMRKGKSEADVLSALGEPRLIARTIIETYGKSDSEGQRADYYSSDYRSAGFDNSSYQNRGNADGYGEEIVEKKFHLPGWLWAIIVIVIVGAILSVVLSILSFLAPVILVFAVVIFLVKLFRDWLN